MAALTSSARRVRARDAKRVVRQLAAEGATSPEALSILERAIARGNVTEPRGYLTKIVNRLEGAPPEPTSIASVQPDEIRERDKARWPGPKLRYGQKHEPKRKPQPNE